jgi:phage recombination protein Bet
MTKDLTTTQSNPLEMLNALRNSVAPGLTDAEFQLFGEIVRSTGLNPITKEVWAIKAGGRLQLMTGINGFLKIANSHPQYDGMEVEYEWDEAKLISATAKVYRKDRRFPSVATAYMAEYKKSTPIWQQMPSVMLAKCAKSLAIREAFIQELGGLYTAEEMPPQYAQATIVPADDEELIVSKKTGEVLGIQKITKEEVDAVKKRAVVTYYDISGIDESKKQAAVEYLVCSSAKEVEPNIWRSPILLSKLNNYVKEGYEPSKAESN